MTLFPKETTPDFLLISKAVTELKQRNPYPNFRFFFTNKIINDIISLYPLWRSV